jgi:hypothetical protein
MARIKVINKQTGQRGTISEEKFDPNLYQQIGPVQSAAYSAAQAAPAVLGTTGAVAGGLLGSIPGGALGAGAGYAGGQAVEDSILKLFGMKQNTGKQDMEMLKETAKGTGNAALWGGLSAAALKALPYIFSPLKKLGQAREVASSKLTITPEQVQKAIETAQTGLKTTPVQDAGKKIGMDWMREFFPEELVTTGQNLGGVAKTELSKTPISGSDFYKILGELEKTAKSFTPTPGTAYPGSQAATAIASNLRQIPGSMSGKVGVLNNILSTLYKAQPYAKKAGYGAVGAGAAGAVTYPLLRALGIGGSK